MQARMIGIAAIMRDATARFEELRPAPSARTSSGGKSDGQWQFPAVIASAVDLSAGKRGS
jgi:hypothetical protein